jgi:hypothetical protein
MEVGEVHPMEVGEVHQTEEEEGRWPGVPAVAGAHQMEVGEVHQWSAPAAGATGLRTGELGARRVAEDGGREGRGQEWRRPRQQRW